jgi:hypothetical protein
MVACVPAHGLVQDVLFALPRLRRAPLCTRRVLAVPPPLPSRRFPLLPRLVQPRLLALRVE